MIKTLIVPGLNGSPAPHWQHHWTISDPTALMVHQANWAAPSPEAWEAEVAGAILTHPGSILVGHSLGAIVICRLLTHWPQLNVAAALLVAPAEPGASPRLADFAPIPRRHLRVPTILVASRNDPWMSFSRAQAFAEAWGSELVDLGFAGHINVESGFGPWPRGMELRDDLRVRAKETPRPLPAERMPVYQRKGWGF